MPVYRGRIVTLDVFGAPIDFLFTYANEGDTPIHERTSVRCSARKVIPHKGGVTQQHPRKGLHQGTQADVFYVVYVGCEYD